jgi:hypothetical protein
LRSIDHVSFAHIALLLIHATAAISGHGIILASKMNLLFFFLLPASSIKLVLEPPRGVRAHLLRLLQQLEGDPFHAGAPRGQAASLAWYRLCLFHAIVVERCSRGKRGYGF